MANSLRLPQLDIWFNQQLHEGQLQDVISGYCMLTGDLVVPQFEQAWKQVVEQAETFTSAFNVCKQNAAQMQPAQEHPQLHYLDASDSDATTPEHLVAMRRLAKQKTGAKSHPNFQCLTKIGEEEYIWFVNIHHIRIDGWGLGILFNQVAKSYMALLSNERASYNFAPQTALVAADQAYLSSESYKKDVAYWQEKHAKVPQTLVKTLPTAEAMRLSTQVANTQKQSLEKVAQEHNASLQQIYLAAFAATNFRFFGTDTLSIGMPVLNRNTKLSKQTLGHFSNIVPLTIDGQAAKSILPLLTQTKSETYGALRHGRLPLSHILRQWQTEDHATKNAFDLVYSYEKIPYISAFENLTGTIHYEAPTQTSHAVTLHLMEYGSSSETTAAFDFHSGHFTETATQQYLALFKTALKAIAQQSTQDFRTFVLPTDNTPRFTGTETTLSPKYNIAAALEEQWKTQPTGIALEYEEQKITYHQTAQEVAAICHWLTEVGFQKGNTIAIALPRTPEMWYTLQALLRMGITYVPIDHKLPLQRIEHIVKAAECKALITHKGSSIQLKTAPVLYLTKEPLRQGMELPQPQANDNDLAYIIFTSGSTGVPKGVKVTHKNVQALFQWAKEEYSKTPFATLLAGTAYTFDLSVFELFFPMSSGKSLRLLDSNLEIAQHLATGSALLINTVPSVVLELLEQEVDWTNVVAINMAGEPIAQAVVDRLPLDTIEVRNLYGPSEDTTYSTCYRLKKKKVPVPIGTPIANTAIQLLNAFGEPVPYGFEGEIQLLGKGVAAGYVGGTPENSKQFSTTHDGTSTYRTGDFAALDADGELVYKGRKDDQVKLRGFRIELQEVGHALEKYPNVKRAMAMVVQPNTPQAMLVVWYVSSTELAAKEMATFLKQSLPDYMIPQQFIFTNEFVLTSNGKIDKQHLIATTATALTDEKRVKVEVSTASEATVAAAFQKVLGTTKVYASDHFFALGGHSLKASRLLHELYRTTGKQLSFKTVFNHPVVSDLAVALEQEALPKQTFAASNATRFPLSRYQKGIWLNAQTDDSYNMSGLFLLEGNIQIDLLEKAFAQLIERHEMLRTRFFVDNGIPTQEVMRPEQVSFSLERCTSQEELETSFNKKFDLSTAPLIRAAMVQQNSKLIELVIHMHHIVSDAWTIRILAKDISEIYAQLENNTAKLPPVALRYVDATQQKLSSANASKHYWNELFKEVPETLYINASRSITANNSNEAANNISTMPAALLNKVDAFAKENNCSRFALFMSSIAILLARFSGQKQVVLGTPVSDRNVPHADEVVGCFINLLALPTKVEGTMPLTEHIERVQQLIANSLQHLDYPYTDLVAEKGQQLFNTMVTYQDEQLSWKDLPIGNGILKMQQPVAVFTEPELTFDFTCVGQKVQMELVYKKAHFDASMAQFYSQAVWNLLEQMVNHKQATVAELPLLTPSEKQELESFQGAILDVEDHLTAVELMQRNAFQEPTATAIRYKGKSTSYADLDEQSTNIAQVLSKNYGIGHGDVVALQMQRSPIIQAAVLAIWKCGAIYMPLDHQSPQARNASMLSESKAKLLLLAKDTLAEEMPCKTLGWPKLNAQLGKNPTTQLHAAQSNDLAYILYTSGSTGQPKGVKIKHRDLSNRLQATAHSYGLSHTIKSMHITALTFDVSMLEMWLPLSTGGCIIVPDAAKERDMLYLSELIRTEKATDVQGTASFVQLLLDQLNEENTNMQRIFVGGDSLREDQVRNIKARFPNALLNNHYGPTETTIDAAYLKDVHHFPVNSIGKPFPNVKIYIIDEYMQPLPKGIFGNMYVGGTGISEGYINRPELTAERFVHYPPNSGERVFNTGDVCRWLNDGTLEFKGRSDRQVKVRGQRIELGEIETIAARIEGIVAVKAIASEITGEKALVLYYQGEEHNTPEQLCTELKKHLNSYMVPQYMQQVVDMPYTTNGKIDDKRLPAIDFQNVESENTAPANATESHLQSLWKQVLRLPHLSTTSNFFELGGQSLSASQVVVRIHEQMRVKIDIGTLYQYPTIQELAAHIATLPTEQDQIAVEPLPKATHYPTSHAQRRLWLIEQNENTGHTYHMYGAYRLQGSLDRVKLQQAFEHLIVQQESLRTVFKMEEGQLRQCILEPAKMQWQLECKTIAEPHLQKTMNAFVEEPFNLATQPPFKASLLQVSNTAAVLVVNIHHIIADGWSVELLINQLMENYAAKKEQPTNPLHYKEFVHWQDQWLQQHQTAAEKFWSTKLDSRYEGFQLPLDFPGEQQKTISGAQEVLLFSMETTAAVQNYALQKGTSLFTCLMAAINASVHHVFGMQRILLGYPVASRPHSAWENEIGLFINTQVLPTAIEEQDSFSSLLNKVHQHMLLAEQYQNYPYDLWWESARTVLGTTDPLQIVAVLQNTNQLHSALQLAGVEVKEEKLPVIGKFPLTYDFSLQQDQLKLELNYQSTKFERGTLLLLLQSLEQLLTTVLIEDTEPLTKTSANETPPTVQELDAEFDF